MLYRAGADVIHGKLSNIHTSGHGGQEEQKLMLRLISQSFLCQFMVNIGCKECILKLQLIAVFQKKIALLWIMVKCWLFSEDTAQVAGKIPSGSVYIDGSGVGDIGNIVLRDRRILSEEGLVVVVVSINMKEFKIAAGPRYYLARICLYERISDLINDAQRLITNTFK